MEKTKIYVITVRDMSSIYSSESVIGFSLSEEEAEYIIYIKNKANHDCGVGYVYNFRDYRYEEVPAMQCEKNDKDYAKFIKEKIEKATKKLNERNSCVEKDTKEITTLTEKIAFYQNKLKK